MRFAMQDFDLLKKKNSELLTELNSEKSAIFDLYSKEIGYSHEDISLLWRDLENFFTEFDSFLKDVISDWDKKSHFYKKWEKGSELCRVPWGKVLICSPSNAVIPLLPILIVSFCVSGNDLIISPSRKALRTAEHLFQIVADVYKPLNWVLELFTGGRMAIDEYVLKRKVNLLYFQGGSKPRSKVYDDCLTNGVDIIYEGEGNQITIIDSVADKYSVKEIAEIIYESKNFCNGQLCTSPNLVFVKREIGDDFLSEYKLLTDNVVLLENPSVANLEDVINNEVFSPSLNLIFYDDLSVFLPIFREHYFFGLQVSVFCRDNEFWKDFILRNVHVARVTLNMNPTYQNSLLPWGGYKKSGFSPVLNFLEKATKNVIVEGNDA